MTTHDKSKGSLRYAVLFADGHWSGLFSTEKQALGCVPKRKGKLGDDECIGVFRFHPRLTSEAQAKQIKRVPRG